jgi:hypothetical protein
MGNEKTAAAKGGSLLLQGWLTNLRHSSKSIKIYIREREREREREGRGRWLLDRMGGQERLSTSFLFIFIPREKIHERAVRRTAILILLRQIANQYEKHFRMKNAKVYSNPRHFYWFSYQSSVNLKNSQSSKIPIPCQNILYV